jgi:hypothetical protein
MLVVRLRVWRPMTMAEGSERIVPILVEVDRNGIGRVRIDGLDIGHALTSFRLIVEAGQMPRLELVAIPSLVIIAADGALSLEGRPIDIVGVVQDPDG